LASGAVVPEPVAFNCVPDAGDVVPSAPVVPPDPAVPDTPAPAPVVETPADPLALGAVVDAEPLALGVVVDAVPLAFGVVVLGEAALEGGVVVVVVLVVLEPPAGAVVLVDDEILNCVDRPSVETTCVVIWPVGSNPWRRWKTTNAARVAGLNTPSGRPR